MKYGDEHMNYSDYIKMTQCGVYSITFPSQNIVETLEHAVLAERNREKFEIVKNLITGKKVITFDDGGLFFSIRAEFKHLTKEQIAFKAFEFKNVTSEKDAVHLAKVELFKVLPPSSEIYNVFYNPNTQILVINSNSKRSKIALMQLVEVFGLVGVKSIIVSEEKLGINTKFSRLLNDNEPLFNSIGFDYEATLRRETEDDKTHRTCRHLDTEEGKHNALDALYNGFIVQSLAMRYEDENGFIVRFKLDEYLRIRAMKFRDFAETARMLRSDSPAKYGILTEYLNCQYHVLNRIIKNTLLEFTKDTKLEQFA